MVDTPTADNPREPDITHVQPLDKKTWLGHPVQLRRLFGIEMWERFGFYGMRALLVLYLTKHFLFQDHQANGIVGGYLSLVYLTPVVGGFLADAYLGSKRAVKFGALVMAVGYLMLCCGGQQAKPFATIDGQRYEVSQAPAVSTLATNTAPQTIQKNGQVLVIHGLPDGSVQLLDGKGQVAETVAANKFVAGAEGSPAHTSFLLFALGLIVIGNGFFKPNISTIVGSLYETGDRRRDAGFTIFYAGINVGSILGQIAVPFLADHFGWGAGFLGVSVVLVLAWAMTQFEGGRLAGYGEPPVRQGPDRTLLIYGLSLASVVLFWMIFSNVIDSPEPSGSSIWEYIVATPLLGKALLVIFLAAVIGIPIWSARVGDKVEREMMFAAILLVIFNVTFWALFEQAASSLTLFADRNTDLALFGFHMSAATTQQFNPIVVVLFAPVLSWLWLALAKRNLEPSIQVKFALALMLVGLGFVVLAASGGTANAAFKVSLWWLVLTYFLHSIAELCISPVGLSMITKLSIARIVGMMMGVWFLSISVGEYLAGAAAQAAAVKTVGGQVTNPELSLHTYLGTFMTGGELTIGAGILLLVLSPLIKKWMHGVQ
ncbi:MAG: peptide MFS transporter [Sphingomonas sp.]|uniref:peptide MFS transporter n=1 Tax=Sphingomonas sp. TaxID=28214 RepID=UPI003F81AFF1